MDFINTINSKEREFFNDLKTVNHPSVWGIAISNVVAKPTVGKFRRLVCEMKSQADNCAEVMLDIIGQNCYNKLVNL